MESRQPSISLQDGERSDRLVLQEHSIKEGDKKLNKWVRRSGNINLWIVFIILLIYKHKINRKKTTQNKKRTIIREFLFMWNSIALNFAWTWKNFGNYSWNTKKPNIFTWQSFTKDPHCASLLCIIFHIIIACIHKIMNECCNQHIFMKCWVYAHVQQIIPLVS